MFRRWVDHAKPCVGGFHPVVHVKPRHDEGGFGETGDVATVHDFFPADGLAALFRDVRRHFIEESRLQGLLGRVGIVRVVHAQTEFIDLLRCPRGASASG